MTNRDDVTKANEEANEAFNGKQPPREKRLEDAKDITEVNEAANAEFNNDDPAKPLGNTVGGLRGSSD